MFNLRDENGTLKAKLPVSMGLKVVSEYPGHWERDKFISDDDMVLILGAGRLPEYEQIRLYFWKGDYVERAKD